MINFCENITCLNNGVCRPSLLDFTCECLGDNYYSGRFCEKSSTKVIIYKTASKSFSYIAIIAISTVAAFVITMDILKYCFGINPTYVDLERVRQEKQTQRRKTRVVQRLTYIHALQ